MFGGNIGVGQEWIQRAQLGAYRAHFVRGDSGSEKENENREEENYVECRHG